MPLHSPQSTTIAIAHPSISAYPPFPNPPEIHTRKRTPLLTSAFIIPLPPDLAFFLKLACSFSQFLHSIAALPLASAFFFVIKFMANCKLCVSAPLSCCLSYSLKIFSI
jgi:hypothetical protein